MSFKQPNDLPQATDYRDATVICVRVLKEDAAYLTAIIDAQPGTVSHTTLPHQEGSAHRDLKLMIPKGNENDVRELINALHGEIMITEL